MKKLIALAFTVLTIAACPDISVDPIVVDVRICIVNGDTVNVTSDNSGLRCVNVDSLVN